MNRKLIILLFWVLCQSLAWAQPTITTFTPSGGPVGTLVTINGTGLNNPTVFAIGGKTAIVISNTGTVLVGLVMPGAVTGAVSVSSVGGSATSATNFTLTPTPFPSLQQGGKLVGTGNVGGTQQGISVSLSADGNTAIVGGPSDNGGLGAAWVYTRSGSTWSQQGGKLVGTNSSGSSYQGSSVALSADGNTAMVGGWIDGGALGAVWVFTRSGSSWSQQGDKLVGTGNTGPAGQGYSVSLSADGNTAIVGGWSDNSQQGAAWVFTRSGSSWSQQGDKLVCTGNTSAAWQGYSVSLSADGNTAMVGGYNDNSGQGAAWVYTRSGSTWSQQGGKLVGTGNVGGAQQGYSVSLSADGNTAIVGGVTDNGGLGAAWVYTRTGSSWSQQGGKLEGTGSVGNAQQGWSVSLSADGNTAIVGGVTDNGGLGAAWVYTRTGSSWSQQGGKLVGTGNVGTAEQGTSVALSANGKTAIVGGRLDNSDQGAAWVYSTDPPTISSFSPTSAATGQTVTITGTNFTGATAVSFGGTAATSFTVVNSTTITAVVASGSSGLVSVTTPGGNASLNGFTYIPGTSTNTWNGLGAWTNPTFWSNGSVPAGSDAVIINSGMPTLAVNATVGNLEIRTGAMVAISSGFSLSVSGNVSGSGIITGAGKVVLNGTGLQTLSGNMRYSNLESGNTSGAGVVVSPASTIRIEPNAPNGTGILTLLNNCKFTNNGTFVLGSNATATARIGPVPASAAFTGEVVMERYLPYTTGIGQWYFLGSPMPNKNFTDYVDDFKMTGLSSGFGQQGGGILSSNDPERSTVFKYDEAQHNVKLDPAQIIGWIIPGNENLVPGTGYRVWVNSYSNSTHKVDNEGTFTRGNFNFPAITRTNLVGCVPSTFACTQSAGWNLLANPYPCDIDWDATGGAWTKPAEMNNAFYTWNATTGGYRVYLGTTGTPGVSLGSTIASTNTPPNIIPSSQAFFVSVTTPGSFTLSLTENAKITATNGAFTRSAFAETERVRIRLKKSDSQVCYDAMVRIEDNAGDGFDVQKDLENFEGAGYSLSIKTDVAENLVLNSIAPISSAKTIGLKTVYKGSFGEYSLQFSEMEGLMENHALFLKDNLLGTLTQITAGMVHNYWVSSTDPMLADRFELILQTNVVTTMNGTRSGVSMSLYPNPTDGKSGSILSLLGFETSTAELIVTDVLGKTVFRKFIAISANGITEYEIKQNLPCGIYTLKTTGGKKTSTQKWVVK